MSRKLGFVDRQVHMGDSRDSVQWSVEEEVHGRAGQAAEPQSPCEEKGGEGVGGKPYLRLWFTCSGQYARAYRSADGRVYFGRCPKCGLTARFPIRQGGTSERFFRVSC